MWLAYVFHSLTHSHLHRVHSIATTNECNGHISWILCLQHRDATLHRRLDYQMLIYRRSCRYVEWCTCENVYEDHSDNWSQFILMDGSFQFHNKRMHAQAHGWTWIERTVSVEKNQCERNIIALRFGKWTLEKKVRLTIKKITRRKLYLFSIALDECNGQWNKHMQRNTIT